MAHLGRRRPAGWPRTRRWSTSTGYSGVVVVFDRCCAAVGLRGRRLASATRAHKHNESMGRRLRNTWISAARLRISMRFFGFGRDDAASARGSALRSATRFRFRENVTRKLMSSYDISKALCQILT